MRSALFFWLLRECFCDVAIWRAVRCEVLFFLAFEGAFLRRRRLEGGRGKKNEQNHRDAVLKRIGATWSCVDRIFFRLIAVI